MFSRGSAQNVRKNRWVYLSILSLNTVSFEQGFISEYVMMKKARGFLVILGGRRLV